VSEITWSNSTRREYRGRHRTFGIETEDRIYHLLNIDWVVCPFLLLESRYLVRQIATEQGCHLIPRIRGIFGKKAPANTFGSTAIYGWARI